ncbi:serine protease inhibitor Cvsi-2-like [Haliotis cracherodii]|uniref:serine protease inhibitor Cvsi-2-like n=1 Tax=Haliotis cracherodii TaxID=6455 RepID=UPI0039E81A22
MQVSLFLAVFCAVIAVIYSETCRDEKDCDHVTCDSTSKLGCSHGECTCLTSATSDSCAQATCSARADCDSCKCRDSRASHHCYDGHCLCGRGGFGPGIGK